MMHAHHVTAPTRQWQHKALKLQYEESDERDIKTTIEATNSNVARRVILPTPSPMPGDCNVKRYILDHTTYYYGDSTFLAGPTQRTQKALSKFKKLLAKEREAGGVLSVDTTTPSTITSHAPGYLLSKDEDIIVGMQSDEPLKRTCKPHGGYGVVKNALIAYGYEPGEKLKAFKDDVMTHNDLTFSMYTSKVNRNCEHWLLIEDTSWCSYHLYFASHIYS
jgi:pyruvate-formate lyase